MDKQGSRLLSSFISVIHSGELYCQDDNATCEFTGYHYKDEQDYADVVPVVGRIMTYVLYMTMRWMAMMFNTLYCCRL